MGKAKKQPQAKISQDVHIKMLLENLNVLSCDLKLVLNEIEDKNQRYKSVNGFKKMLRDRFNIRERVENIENSIDAIRGKNRAPKLDMEVLNDAKMHLQEVGGYIDFIKQLANSEISSDHNFRLADALQGPTKWAGHCWNEVVEEFDDKVVNHGLTKVYGLGDY